MRTPHRLRWWPLAARPARRNPTYHRVGVLELDGRINRIPRYGSTGAGTGRMSSERTLVSSRMLPMASLLGRSAGGPRDTQ